MGLKCISQGPLLLHIPCNLFYKPLDKYHNMASEIKQNMRNGEKFWHGILLTLKYTAHKKSFPLKISSENVTKSAVSCEFRHIY